MPSGKARQWTTERLTRDLATTMRLRQYLPVTEVTTPRGHRIDMACMLRRIEDKPLMLFEIKVSRSDFLADVRAKKWRNYLEFGALSFAAPYGLIDASEIPDGLGFMQRHANSWRWKISPRLREAPKPTWWMYRRLIMRAADESHWRGMTIKVRRLRERKERGFVTTSPF